MKERVMVKYQFSNDPHDKTWNCFFVLRDNAQPLTVLDVLSEFPPFKTGEYQEKGFHFRFLDRLGKVQCWVDIKNLNASVPIQKQAVEMRVLILPSQSDSTIFGFVHRDLARRSAKLQEIREAELQRARESIKQPTKQPPKQDTTSNASVQKPRASQTDSDLFLGNDFDLSKEPGSGKTKTQQSPTYAKQSKEVPFDDFDILGGENGAAHHEEKEENGNGISQEQRMSEMFGEDFDPKATNKVLDVIYINKRKEELTKTNIENIDNRHKKNLEMQDAKLQAGLALEPKVKVWAHASNGSKNNIRILLTTLNQILWEGADFDPISMADLVSDNQVKKQYMKAIMKVHPDQNSEVSDPSIMYLMDRIFNLLNDSYSEFCKSKK